MDKIGRTSNFIIMGLIIIAIVVGNIMKEPTTVDFKLNINEINASKICSDIKGKIGAPEDSVLYIKNMDVDTKGQTVTNSGDPAFNLTISKDGIIDRILWNMTFKDQYESYNIYQASGGNKIRKGKEDLVLTKSGKSDNVGENNIKLENTLMAIKSIPWSSAIKEMPKSDYYMMRLEKFDPKSIESKYKSVLYIDKNGGIVKITGEKISKLTGDVLQIPIGLVDNKGHGEESGVVFLIELVK